MSLKALAEKVLLRDRPRDTGGTAAENLVPPIVPAPPSAGTAFGTKANVDIAPVRVPPEWIAGAAKLRAMSSPAMVAPAAWATLQRASDRFIAEGWAAKAAALGWAALDVWGCHRERPVQRLDLAGAAWLIGSDEIAGIAEATIALRPRTGSGLTIYRRRWPAGEPVCLAWEIPGR